MLTSRPDAIVVRVPTTAKTHSVCGVAALVHGAAVVKFWPSVLLQPAVLTWRGFVFSAVGGKVRPPTPTHRVNTRPRISPTSPPCKVNTQQLLPGTCHSCCIGEMSTSEGVGKPNTYD
ncbi:hypothetical protein EYF80_013323 [Liparis tanakae]|uniref:Uncharacterized protein n=1 Tax=Liparis tanakae TaxID=230148 RepID=A0A4Z2IEP7_9TELE|nr:hypothetical protein EYF80_013323 [Liparis tanakae]